MEDKKTANVTHNTIPARKPAATPFKSRFLGKGKLVADGNGTSGYSPPEVNRSSSGSSNSSSGYCTYTNENGLLRFTITPPSATVAEEDREEEMDTVAEPARRPNMPISDLGRRNSAKKEPAAVSYTHLTLPTNREV